MSTPRVRPSRPHLSRKHKNRKPESKTVFPSTTLMSVKRKSAKRKSAKRKTKPISISMKKAIAPAPNWTSLEPISIWAMKMARAISWAKCSPKVTTPSSNKLKNYSTSYSDLIASK